MKQNKVDYMESVRQAIKTNRVAKGWSQSDLAEKIGKKKQYISQIETGKDTLSMKKANEILKIFDIEAQIVLVNLKKSE